MNVAALILAGKNHAAKVLPNETHQSYPIPVRDSSGLSVAFLYCTSRSVPREGRHLLPPSRIAFLDAATGQAWRLRPTTPAALGRRDDPTRFVGVHRMPSGMRTEEFVEKRDRLYALYDALIPRYAQGRLEADQQTRAAAAEFLALFPRLAEQPLLPYYRAAGRDFFAWVERVSR